jgi:hypothetical protein
VSWKLRPCSSAQELRAALGPIAHYFRTLGFQRRSLRADRAGAARRATVRRVGRRSCGRRRDRFASSFVRSSHEQPHGGGRAQPSRPPAASREGALLLPLVMPPRTPLQRKNHRREQVPSYCRLLLLRCATLADATEALRINGGADHLPPNDERVIAVPDDSLAVLAVVDGQAPMVTPVKNGITGYVEPGGNRAQAVVVALHARSGVSV